MNKIIKLSSYNYYNNNNYNQRQNGFAFYKYMKRVLLGLGTKLETFEEASECCKNVLLAHYKQLPNDLLYCAIATWFYLKLKYKTKIRHIAISTTTEAENINNKNNSRLLRCFYVKIIILNMLIKLECSGSLLHISWIYEYSLKKNGKGFKKR